MVADFHANTLASCLNVKREHINQIAVLYDDLDDIMWVLTAMANAGVDGKVSNLVAKTLFRRMARLGHKFTSLAERTIEKLV